MEITIERVTPEEAPLLLEWRMRVLREVFADHGDADWESIRSGNEAYYAVHLADGTHVACFARDEAGRIVGCGGICYQQELPSPDNPRGGCGYLMNIFTIPELRGRGIGKKIVAYLVADAKARHTEKIYLESSEAAKRMYMRLGFRPMRDYYKLEG